MAIDAVVNDSTLDVSLTGLDAVWGLRRRVSIPLDTVVSARVTPTASAKEQLGIRLHGTWFPGRLHAGTFLLADRPGPFRTRPRAFVFTRRASTVLEVHTTLNDPAVVLLEHPDAHDLAWFIGERIA